MKRKNLLSVLATGMIFTIGTAVTLGTTGCGQAQQETATSTDETADDQTGESTDSESTESESGDSETSDTASSVSSAEIINASTDTTTIGAVTSVSELDFENMFTSRDLDTGFDEESSANITLNGDEVEVSGNGVSADGTTITITSEGTYIFSGTLNDGQIVVDAADTDKVQIVLNGVTITNDDSACIYVKSADKVFITLAKNSENTLQDTGSEYVQEDTETNVDGVIFSKDDITFNGDGTLNIKAGYANGIVGKDDVKFTSGTYNVTATGNALEGKDSIRIKDGTFNLVSGSEKDGIHTSNEEESGKGYIYIEGGDITINAEDDGIHAGTVLYIAGGTINVEKSYEGLEGDTIDITGGDISVVSSDDGLNASTSTSQDSFGFGGMGGGMDYDENAYIHIYGGDLYVNSQGDGIDSNGDLYIDGGTIVVDGPENNGNGALDKGGVAVISGGSVIAVGASGMAETFSQDSEQYSVLYNFETTLSAGTEITITDSDGNKLMEYTMTKTGNSVVFSSDELKEGDYTITAGDTTDTFTVSDKATTAGAQSQMMPGGGHMGGGRGNKEAFQNGEMPEGERPNFENGERPTMPDGQMPNGQAPDGQAPEGQAPDGQMPEEGTSDSQTNESSAQDSESSTDA